MNDAYSHWQECANVLLAGVPYAHPDAHDIVLASRPLPSELGGPVMVRALAERFGIAAGLTREQFEVCLFGPFTVGTPQIDPAVQPQRRAA